MYVHSLVEMPIETTREIRVQVYRLFFYNTPFDAFNVIMSIRFRLFFVRGDPEDVAIQRLTLLPYPGGPSLYPSDLEWT